MKSVPRTRHISIADFSTCCCLHSGAASAVHAVSANASSHHFFKLFNSFLQMVFSIDPHRQHHPPQRLASSGVNLTSKSRRARSNASRTSAALPAQLIPVSRPRMILCLVDPSAAVMVADTTRLALIDVEIVHR